MRIIDADALKQNINTTFWAEIGKIIDDAPTIDAVEVVRGEWKRYMGDIWTCTACGESLMCDDIECNNYCPNCGARMLKGADDDSKRD